ncbi:hypothetical protein AGOR_G00163050 [Albula goreensis]|uniref:Uncharacterized protein n=1 Tax=Albula goreensis TaxID=1534307 RepID=A0A8T3D3T8_9TELE|nr:hypothetical protein AGOR_G00163050 [Albula goreensis]
MSHYLLESLIQSIYIQQRTWKKKGTSFPRLRGDSYSDCLTLVLERQRGTSEKERGKRQRETVYDVLEE